MIQPKICKTNKELLDELKKSKKNRTIIFDEANFYSHPIKKKILHLHVRKKYWEQVRDKKKTKEYRLIKPYWIKMLQKNYDLIYYYPGYTSKKLIFKYNYFDIETIKHEEFGDKPVNVFAIDLTKLLGEE